MTVAHQRRGGGQSTVTVAFGTAKAPAWRQFASPLAGKLEGLVFSLKTFAAAILALVISYWLEVKDPQWAVFTTYLLAQPLVGAVWAKGAFRLVGTVGGAVFAVLCVGLFAQAGPLFILAMALWLALCTYGATLARNYASYGFALAGFSAPLIGFGSVATPDQVWSMAVDRTTEVALGIVCVGLVHVLVLPRYAGDALRASLATTFSSLAHYAAIVLRPGTPEKVFTDIRRQMSGEVIKFDSLRSYAVFEAPELRGHDEALSRMMRAFLGLLSVARGLYVRLDDLRRHEDQTMAARLDPALGKVADLFEAIAADRGGPSSPAVNAALAAARDVTGQAQAQLEAMVESEPLESLANGLLVLQRTGDMITSLSRVVVGVTGAPAEPSGPRVVAAIEQDRGAALAQAARAASALILIGVFWVASAWTAGAMAMTGLAIMMVFFVTSENPGRVALSYVLVVALAMVVAFFCMAFLMPRLDDFAMLAALLAVVLIPAGIIMSNPRYAFVAAAFAAFFLSQLGLSNLPSFDTATYIDNSIGLLLGLAAGVLAIDLILPYNPATTRRREWAEVVAALPAAARGERPEIGARLPIQLALLQLMPRLDLGVHSDDEILGGSFGAASMSLELVRLRNRIAHPAFPADARDAVTACLDTLARDFERLVQGKSQADRVKIMDEASRAVAAARTRLATEPPMTTRKISADTIALAHALASLRFIADRLDIDRPFLTRTLS
jgi:uncharacterized membrane protein YccC